MKFINENWKKLVLLSYLFIIPVISFAGDGDTPADPSLGKIVNPVPKITSVPGLIRTLLDGVLTIGIPIVALVIIYAGFLFVAARGNTEKLGEAKNALWNAIIGAAILLGAWSIAKLIQATVTGLAG